MTLTTVFGISFSIYHSVWGIVYLLVGHAKCLLSNRRTTSHFLYFYKRSFEVGVQKIFHYEKTFSFSVGCNLHCIMWYIEKHCHLS